jgi:hypothetical protein
MRCYPHFTLTRGRSPGFGSRTANFSPFSDSLSLRLRLLTLTLLAALTRRFILQKARRHTLLVLRLIVGTRFQVLFHSAPAVLFTFPSRYSSLSVAREYLALGGGPPRFPRGFSCPAVLGVKRQSRVRFEYGALTLYRRPSHTVPLRTSFSYSVMGLQPHLRLPRYPENATPARSLALPV